MAEGLYLSPSDLSRFLKEKGFIRKASDPCSCSWVKGKIIVSFDPESPIFLAHLIEDIRKQQQLEQWVEDKFIQDISAFAKQCMSKASSSE